MLEIDASWIGPWAILVAHSTEGGIDAAVAVVGRHGRPTRAPTASADLSPRERIMQLRAESSPEAYRLASYLAAAPLTLPVMRTVQAAMMPTSTPAHLAEILFSGILTTVDGSADASPDECLYEFVDGIRDVLLGTLRRHEAVQVIDAVSDFVEQRIHQPGAGLPAVIASPQGKESISAVSRPFAGIRADVLLRAQQGPAIGAAAGFSHSIGVHDGPPTCTVATVLSKQNTPVGEAVLVDARYFATCAHVINAATDRPPQEPSWPEEAVVRLRIPVRGTVVDVDATIAVWRPYRVNFVDMDLAILRVDDLQLGPIFPAALASVSSAGDVLIEARDDVVVSGELGTDRVSLTLDPGFTGEIVSGARVWKMPGAEELAGIVQSPHDLGSALEVYRIVPALLIRETLTGYLGRGAGSVSVRPGAHAVTAEEDQSGRLEPEPAGTHQAVEDIETTAELPPMSDGLADTAGFSPDFTTSGTGLEDPRAKAAMEVTSPDDGQRYTRKWNRRGYKVDEVDGYVKVIEQTLADYASGAVVGRPLVTSQDVHDSIFRVRFGGYDEWEVDLYLDRAERQLAEHEDRNSFPKDWTG
jgi:DivIVA domain-containing protein